MIDERLKKKIKVIETFKSCVAEIKLNENLEELITFFKKLKINEGRKLSNVGGFQSKNLNLNDPSLKSLIEKIEDFSNIFCNQFLNINKKLNLINIWANINNFKDFNLPHVHNFSILSGVFYIKIPKNSGSLIFKSNDQLENFVHPSLIVNYNNYNSSIWKFSPKINTLYLFPSWYIHYVESNLSNKERISTSFNLV
jgi:uncharacterized protein (TIGR02466 family)